MHFEFNLILISIAMHNLLQGKLHDFAYSITLMKCQG